MLTAFILCWLFCCWQIWQKQYDNWTETKKITGTTLVLGNGNEKNHLPLTSSTFQGKKRKSWDLTFSYSFYWSVFWNILWKLKWSNSSLLEVVFIPKWTFSYLSAAYPARVGRALACILARRSRTKIQTHWINSCCSEREPVLLFQVSAGERKQRKSSLKFPWGDQTSLMICRKTHQKCTIGNSIIYRTQIRRSRMIEAKSREWLKAGVNMNRSEI